MEQIYVGDIRNEHFGLMITAFSNMSCGLAGVSLKHFGVNVPPLFSQLLLVHVSHTSRHPSYLLETMISTVAAVRISLSHRTCGLYRLTARSQTWPQETENNHERVLRCPAPCFYAEQN
jgi:hypothetical protein